MSTAAGRSAWVLDVASERRVARWSVRLARLCRRQPLGLVGAMLVLALIAVAALAPTLAPYDYAETRVLERLQGPSQRHLLGTDQFGRDVFSRIIYGTRPTVYISFGATLLTLVTSTVMGIVSAYYLGWFDTVLQRLIDIWLSFPLIILALVTISVFGGGVVQLIMVLGLLTAAGNVRVIRSKALIVIQQPFIEAARAVGGSDLRIVISHILPNVTPTAIVLSAVRLGAVVITEATLSFLGFGVPPPFPTWGQMLQDSLAKASSHPWLAFWPGLAIALTVFGYNMLGDALRDELDPRLRRT
jgi:peptide/nickel transport system permease protein